MQCEQLGPGKCVARATVVIDTLSSMIPSCETHAQPYEKRYSVIRDTHGHRIIPIDDLTPDQMAKTMDQNRERRRIIDEMVGPLELAAWRKKYIGVVE